MFKLINRLTRNTLLLFSIFLLLIFPANHTQALDQDLPPIAKKITKSYSDKFCNAIGIGMSNESALRIAIEENKKFKYNPNLWIDLVFADNNNLNDINELNLDYQISESISEKCGRAINILYEDDIKDFSLKFEQMRKEYS